MASARPDGRNVRLYFYFYFSYLAGGCVDDENEANSRRNEKKDRNITFAPYKSAGNLYEQTFQPPTGKIPLYRLPLLCRFLGRLS